MISRLVSVCLLGGLLCTLLDQVHVHTATLSYPHPLVYGQAWWVWPLFTGATLANILGYPLGSMFVRDPHDLTDKRDRSGTREFIGALAWFIAVYAVSGFANAFPIVLTIAFITSFLARAILDGTPALWLNAVALAVTGVATEALLCRLGCFRYEVPVVSQALPVPVWLAGIYLHAVFVVRAAFRRGIIESVYPTGAKS